MSAEAVTNLDDLESNGVVLPELSRRLVDYLNLGDSSWAGFPRLPDQNAGRVFILLTGHSTTGLDRIVQIDGDTVRMTHPSEHLVLDEKQATYTGMAHRSLT